MLVCFALLAPFGATNCAGYRLQWLGQLLGSQLAGDDVRVQHDAVSQSGSRALQWLGMYKHLAIQLPLFL
jgi:hypothetical protein